MICVRSRRLHLTVKCFASPDRRELREIAAISLWQEVDHELGQGAVTAFQDVGGNLTTSRKSTDLLDEVRSCTICRDLPLGPRPIVQFSPPAKLLIVGQAPGRITHNKGVPFDDPSGDRLRAWMGIDRETFYDSETVAIVPMGFCFPGTGKGGDLAPRTECAPAWRGRILGTLTSLELTLVIGRYALDWHLPAMRKLTVTEAIKNWKTVWPDQMILPHPSPRNNRWLKQNPWFDQDIIPILQRRVQRLL